MSDRREITVGENDDGEPVALPVIRLLTGRGFVTGKSGSGKSNTASVVAEELLEAGYPLLVVDTDGEYYGLKEEYEMLHAGADEECDIQIGPEHADRIATIALEENVPVILDVSGYLEEGVANELLRETARQLFVKEKKLKKPFLLVVEEVHEYIPEGGGVGETGRMLIKIGKRGRKHGLGIVGISQRPADVKKDFITQANWLVWHRLTWDNDTNVVGRIIDSEYAERVSELGDGEAFLQTDWTDGGVRKIQFRRKRTFDAGATPGLEDVDRPDLKSVSDTLVDDLQSISERQQRERSRIEELEAELDERERRIDDLEDELAAARDVSAAAERMADALAQPETVQSQLPDSSEELRRLHEEVVSLEDACEELEAELDAREVELTGLESERDALAAELADREDELEARSQRIDALERENERLRARLRTLEDEGEGESKNEETDADDAAVRNESDEEIVHGDGDPIEFGYTTVSDDTEKDDATDSDEPSRLEEVLETPGVRNHLERACANSRCSEETAQRVVSTLAREGPLRTEAIATRVDRSPVAVQSLLSELRTESILDRTAERTYALDDDVVASLATDPTDP